jgi:ASC-1-like (ASCH) protein
MKHDLKIDDVYLQAKLAGDKLFEIRLNDRGYQKGDIVHYYGEITDMVEPPQKHSFVITYVTNFAQKENWVVFGERRIA